MKNALLILGITICVLGGIVGGIYWHQHDDVYFTGKEVFQTQEDYSAFKLEVAKQTCQIQKVAVLSSEPPIVVDFRVRVPYDYEFPYGKYDGTTNSWSCLIFLLLPIGVMVARLIANILDRLEAKRRIVE